MSKLTSTRTFNTGMPFSTMTFTPHLPNTASEKQYSNVSQICLGNKECIAKRDAANALAARQLAEQQAVLMQALNGKSGGLGGGAIALIVVGLLGITGLSIYLIKKHKI